MSKYGYNPYTELVAESETKAWEYFTAQQEKSSKLRRRLAAFMFIGAVIAYMGLSTRYGDEVTMVCAFITIAFSLVVHRYTEAEQEKQTDWHMYHDALHSADVASPSDSSE